MTAGRRFLIVLRLLPILLLAATLAAASVATVWSMWMASRGARVSLGVFAGIGIGDYHDARRARATGGVRIDSVVPGGPAARAGLTSGDLLVAVDGVALREHPGAYYGVPVRGRPGQVVSLEWTRGGARHLGRMVLGPPRHIQVSLVFPGGQRLRLPTPLFIGAWIGPFLLFYVACVVVGTMVGLLRLRDRVAYCMSLGLLGAGAVSFFTNTPLMALWPGWLVHAGELASWIGTVITFPLLILVFSTFPVRTGLGDTVSRFQWLLWTVFALPGALALGHELLPSLRPLIGRLGRTLLLENQVGQFLVFVPLLVALYLAQRRATRRQSARRLRAVEVALVFLIAGPLTFVLTQGFLSGLAFGIPVVLMVIGVACLGHAVVAHRLFDIRFVIRRGLQHLLLSRGVLAFEGLVVFIVLAELLQRTRSAIAESTVALAGVSLGAAALGVTVLRRANRPLMAVLDRRFFREVHDARQVLVGLGQQVAGLTEPAAILERAREAVSTALHPARLAFLERVPAAGWAPSHAGGSGAVPATGETAVSAEELAALADPLAQLESGRPLAESPLSRDEVDARDATRPAPYELLVALRTGEGLLGCMALGAKRSEEPYSREDRDLLQAVAMQMGLALRNAELLEVARREAQQARDLEIARQVQRNLFPQSLPAVPGWDFAGLCRPARAVGGDYYDLFAVAPGRVLLALGDVSGKGLGAALLMASAQAVIRSRAAALATDLPRAVAEINQQMLAAMAPGRFVSLFIGVLETATGNLRYVNCGHPPPVLMRSDGSTDLLHVGGTLLGIAPDTRFAEGACGLCADDRLVLYSDGVTEAVREGDEMFDERGLLAALSTAGDRGAGPLAERVIAEVDRFADGHEQSDDISVVVVRRAPLGACSRPG